GGSGGDEVRHGVERERVLGGADAAPGGPGVGLRPADAGDGRRLNGSHLVLGGMAHPPRRSTVRGHDLNAGNVPNPDPLSAYLRGAPTYDASRLPADWKIPRFLCTSAVDLHLAGVLRKIPDGTA